MTPPFPALLSGSAGGVQTNNNEVSNVEVNTTVSGNPTPLRRRTTYDQQVPLHQSGYKPHYLDEFSWFGSNNKKRDFRRAIRSWSGYGTLSGTSDTGTNVADLPHQQQQVLQGGGGESPLLGTKRRAREPQIIRSSSNSLSAGFKWTSDSKNRSDKYNNQSDNRGGVRLGASATSPVPLTHAASVGSGVNKKTRNSLWTMPGIKSLVSRRRNSGGNLDVTSTNNPSSTTTSPTAPLVTRRPNNTAHPTTSGTNHSLIKPEISISSTSGITTSFNPQQHSSSSSLLRPAALLGSLVNLRRCGDPFGLSNTLHSSTSSSSIEPLQPINRLRVSPHGSTARMCSRCSSLLTLATTGSRYSLDKAAGHGFVSVRGDSEDVRLTSGSGVDDTRKTGRCLGSILCKMCLEEVRVQDSCVLDQCNCCFCVECMCAYVKYEIAQGAYDISCPDAQCPAQGCLTQQEIKRLAGNDLLEKHLKYRLNREVEIDKSRMWCPRAGCETVCNLCAASQRCEPQSVHCPTCTVDFCSNCKLEWHSGLSCDDNTKQLAKEGRVEEVGIPFDSDLIKCCPMCKVPIEKDEGCAQMMCKRCKHVFCWYCLASLDDDFLLRHYDKGPCKNKLGHSRASVIWHRTQVITIFAGFGILLLVASPLLLLAAPCIVCCKCRVCNAGTAAAAAASSSASKLDDDEDDIDEEVVSLNQRRQRRKNDVNTLGLLEERTRLAMVEGDGERVVENAVDSGGGRVN